MAIIKITLFEGVIFVYFWWFFVERKCLILTFKVAYIFSTTHCTTAFHISAEWSMVKKWYIHNPVIISMMTLFATIIDAFQALTFFKKKSFIINVWQVFLIPPLLCNLSFNLSYLSNFFCALIKFNDAFQLRQSNQEWTNSIF